jgi:rhodanese-related sulfurtransferase
MPVRRIGPGEASHLLAEGDWDLVDVSEPVEWEGGRLPGSRHVPLGKLLRDPAGSLRQDRVIFVCAHGVRSLTAAAVAASRGLAEVCSLDGGTVGWAEAGFPVER